MFSVIGWSSSDKVPGYYAQSKWGVGRQSIGAIAVVCALTGTKTSAGSMTADSSVEYAYSESDVADLAGPRSTMMQQARAAFKVSGVNVVLVPPAEATGTSATATVQFGGSWTSAGSVQVWIGGELAEVNVKSADTVTDVGNTFEDAVNANQYGPATATNASGTVSLAIQSVGIQGNQYLIGWDMSQAPAGLTVTVTGGTPLHTKLVPFANGTGTESVANIINLMESGVFDYIAVAQTDTTNAGLWKAHVDSEESPTIAHLEHLIFGHIGNLSAATTFASSTLNAVRAAVVWYENCETHPAAIAANAAAYRSSVVGENPNSVYCDVALTGVAPQRYVEDSPNHNTLSAALNSGVTPLWYSDGYVRIVRDCVTKCLTGTTPNYNTYGWPDADVPDRMRKELGALWTARKVGNPYCGPDVATGAKPAGSGVETPKTFGMAATALWKEKEAENWIHQVDENPLVVEYNTTRKCLVTSAPVVVRPQNIQNGAIISQTNA